MTFGIYTYHKLWSSTAAVSAAASAPGVTTFSAMPASKSSKLQTNEVEVAGEWLRERPFPKQASKDRGALQLLCLEELCYTNMMHNWEWGDEKRHLDYVT